MSIPIVMYAYRVFMWASFRHRLLQASVEVFIMETNRELSKVISETSTFILLFLTHPFYSPWVILMAEVRFSLVT